MSVEKAMHVLLASFGRTKWTVLVRPKKKWWPAFVVSRILSRNNKRMCVARVRNKAGEDLGVVSEENIEAFLREQAAIPGRGGKKARLGIGLQCSNGCHIIASAGDVAALEGGDSELEGELILATKGRKGYEMWKCV